MTAKRLLTVRLEPETHQKLKVLAAVRQRSMQRIAEEAIAEVVDRRAEPTREK